MNIIVYGVPEEIAKRIASEYGLKTISAFDRIDRDTTGSLLSIAPTSDPQQLSALYNAMTNREDRIDAVILCGFDPCATASTIRCCAPQGKLFTLNRDTGRDALQEELSNIIETLSGMLCAHEGI